MNRYSVSIGQDLSKNMSFSGVTKKNPEQTIHKLCYPNLINNLVTFFQLFWFLKVKLCLKIIDFSFHHTSTSLIKINLIHIISNLINCVLATMELSKYLYNVSCSTSTFSVVFYLFWTIIYWRALCFLTLIQNGTTSNNKSTASPCQVFT